MTIKRPKGRPRLYDECAQALIDGTETEVQCETRTEADSLMRSIKRKLPDNSPKHPRAVNSDGIFVVFLI